MSVRLCPSILTLDKSQILLELSKVSDVADLLHLDVMDGKFVPAQTFSLAESEALIRGSTLPTDAHLMVLDCDYWGPTYAELGCASVTIHVEATKNISQTVKAIRALGARASIAIKPNTAVHDYEPYLDEIDMVLIMTVEPGAGGQKFMPEMMAKVRHIRSLIGSRDIWLQVDGGINLSTIEIASEAGADTFVAGSAVFNAQDPAAMVKSLRQLAAPYGQGA